MGRQTTQPPLMCGRWVALWQSCCWASPSSQVCPFLSFSFHYLFIVVRQYIPETTFFGCHVFDTLDGHLVIISTVQLAKQGYCSTWLLSLLLRPLSMYHAAGILSKAAEITRHKHRHVQELISSTSQPSNCSQTGFYGAGKNEAD